MSDALHEHWPDAWFAARFLPRDVRQAVVTVFAVMRQLGEVVCGQECDAGSGPPSGGGGGGCGCGPGDERRRVALAILDHLWRGEPTGKAELDGFAAVARERQLQQDWFESWINAMLAPLPPRIATWKRLREHGEAKSEPLARILGAIVGCDASAQATALITAIMLSRTIERVRDDASVGRVALPLDDLVKYRLSDRDVMQLSKPDDRWRALVDFEAGRIQSLFDGGAKCITALPAPRTRRALSVLVELERHRLARVTDALRTLTPLRHDTTLRHRLRTLPRAIRAAT